MPKELLIADANVTAQEEFEKIFEGMDAQLIFAENGEDALLKIKLYKPDLVIADVTMPNKDGFELCKIVKANPELQQIPFVLLAGIFEGIDQSEQEKVGADGVVAKPLNGEEILPLVKDLLESEPVPPRVEETSGTAEAGAEETLLSMEELSTSEDLEEVELPVAEEIPETQPPGEEEAIIELTEVVDEETSPRVFSDESAVDESQEYVKEGHEEPLLEEEALDEISLEGFDLEEPEEELELEEVELAEERGAQEKEAKTEEAETDTTEHVELEVATENHLDQEERQKPSDETVEAELEEEIDRRIDLVLEEEQEEEDTLLELEEGEEESYPAPGGMEEPESLPEEIPQSEIPEISPRADESLRDEEETLLELGESEEPEEMLEEEDLSEGRSFDGLEDAEEGESLESLPAEASEKEWKEHDEPSDQALDVFSDDLEELSIEELENLGETVKELEELPIEEELHGLLEEGAEEFEEPGEAPEEKPSGEDTGPERLGEVLAEEGSDIEEIIEEASDVEDVEGKVDEEELVHFEPEDITETLDARTVEEGGEEPLEDLEEGLLEEGLGEGEDVLEEGLEEVAEESIEPFSYPSKLIKEGSVSEEEVDAFQKRLTADLEGMESGADVVGEASDERVEYLVRKGVEQVLNNLSESVIPELTKVLVQVASERIEKVVQKVVPELAESAIKKEIERLQRED